MRGVSLWVDAGWCRPKLPRLHYVPQYLCRVCFLKNSYQCTHRVYIYVRLWLSDWLFDWGWGCGGREYHEYKHQRKCQGAGMEAMRDSVTKMLIDNANFKTYCIRARAIFSAAHIHRYTQTQTNAHRLQHKNPMTALQHLKFQLQMDYSRIPYFPHRWLIVTHRVS